MQWILVLLMIARLGQPSEVPNKFEFEYLCQAVEAEAGICGVDEKLEVAQCILNRVADDGFADTITGVIQEPGQFQVYANSRILEVEVEQSTVKAVIMAISTAYESETLYFCNYDIISDTKKAWFDKLQLLIELEYMNYYR